MTRAPRLQRWRARARLRDRFGLWYHTEYVAPCLGRTARVPGIDLARSERAIAYIVDRGLARVDDIRQPDLAAIPDLARVHSSAYLESTARPEVLGHVFGLEAHTVDVDCLLRAQRRAVGGTIGAATWAVEREGRIAFNLGGGFHHAEPEMGSGFCVYNDVAVAIRALRAGGMASPIAIVDLDYHQGNGNIVSFAQDPSVLTFSIHGSVWSHAAALSDEQVLLPPETGDAAYLRALDGTLRPRLEAHRPALIFYIAGNDVLFGDALGGFSLTTGGVLSRDRLVVETARDLGSAVVVTLGGGYSTRAWRATADFVCWLLTGAVSEEARADLDPEVRQSFERIAQTLGARELQGEPAALELTEQDILGDLGVRPAHRRLLGYYTADGVELAFERYGIFDALRARGFSDLRVTVEPDDPDHQRVFVDGRKAGARHLLIETVLRKRRIVARDRSALPSLEMLSVEWLLLQDPTEAFSLRRPRLPGQSHPGLGLLPEIVELLRQICRRLDLDGVLFQPSHYHVAALGADHGRFLDPAVQGRFDAMRAALAERDLADASLLLESGQVRDRAGSRLSWQPAAFAAAVSPPLIEYLESPAYETERRAAREAARCELEPTATARAARS
jgi:acetoin utilization deacetylase AcuC-like enzyme